MEAVGWRSWRRAKEKWDIPCTIGQGADVDLLLLVLIWKWEQKLEKLSVLIWSQLLQDSWLSFLEVSPSPASYCLLHDRLLNQR